jgi:trans-aconitate 2-methyltransferase
VSLRGHETIMDAGCGTGKLTAELLEQLPDGRVVAVDLSHNMLVTARDHLSRFREHVFFVAADLQHLPFSGAFDGVFSTAAFHWVPDHERLFGALYAALKPGGWLIAQCGAAQNLERLLARVEDLKNSSKYEAYLGDYRHSWVYSDAQAAARRLRCAGFADVDTNIEPAPTRFDTADDYREFVSKVILHRHLERLPSSALRNEFMNNVVQQAAADNPPFELDYWRLNLRGTRP